MFLDPTRFRVPPLLQANSATFRRELDALRRDDFAPWPQTAAYEGRWLLFAMWLHQAPPDLGADFEANRRLCPETTRCLQDIGGIRSACFSWLDPSTHILPHTDAYYPGVIRIHLGLRIPPKALVRVAAERLALSEGQVIMIDGQVEHEVANLSGSPRVTLLVDAQMSADEIRYVLAHSPRRHALQSGQDGPDQVASSPSAAQ